jgi:hypothetical protein
MPSARPNSGSGAWPGNGRIDLFKLQLFLVTVLIAGYGVFRVVRQSAFPALDPQFLMLMVVTASTSAASSRSPARWPSPRR